MKGDKKRFIFKKVKCIIASENDRTDIIELSDPKRNLFKRGGIDSFMLILDRSVLKNIKFFKIYLND